MSRHDDPRRDLGAGPIAVAGKSIVRAKGYSLLELERAGLTEDDARRLGLAIDPERKSMLGSNVTQLWRLKPV